MTQRYREEDKLRHVKRVEMENKRRGNPSDRKGERGQSSEYFFIDT
jgi:hypothetical protein